MNHDQFMATVPPALEEAALYKQRREPLLNYENQYEYLSTETLGRIQKRLNILGDGQTHWGAAGGLAENAVTYLCLQYSAGAEVSALARFYPTAVWEWEKIESTKKLGMPVRTFWKA